MGPYHSDGGSHSGGAWQARKFEVVWSGSTLYRRFPAYAVWDGQKIYFGLVTAQLGLVTVQLGLVTAQLENCEKDTISN